MITRQAEFGFSSARSRGFFAASCPVASAVGKFFQGQGAAKSRFFIHLNFIRKAKQSDLFSQVYAPKQCVLDFGLSCSVSTTATNSHS